MLLCGQESIIKPGRIRYSGLYFFFYSLNRVEKVKPALYGAFQNGPGNQQPVDLVGTLKDSVNAGIPVYPLGRIFGYITIAAKDLYNLVGAKITAFTAIYLRN